MNIFKSSYKSGIVDDWRTPEEKAKDYHIKETVAALEPVNWIEKAPADWRRFEIRDQDGSSTCVAQTAAKILGICHYLNKGYYPNLSASFIYQRRANKPGEGMGGVDVWEIVKDSGTVLEELMKSQNINEKAVDIVKEQPVYKDIATVFSIKNYLAIDTDIDSIASVIQKTKKPVMVWFSFAYDEWTDVPTIKKGGSLRHSVTAVDYTLYKGKKALIIEDSWGDFGEFNGQRVITEDFMSRCFYAAYPIAFKYEPDTTGKPVFKESTIESETIKSLQDCLKWEGFFPTNVESTGYFGSITKSALIKFQTKYGLPAYGYFGSMTKAKLKELFS